MDEKIEALREKAKAATPGPWGFQYTDEAGECFIIAQHFGGMVGAALPWPTEIDARDFRRVVANADFIAAASPDVILSILSERDRLRAALGTIANETARCVHDGGFDREIGPIGCLLGEKCVCIGVHPVARAALTPMDVKEERG